MGGQGGGTPPAMGGGYAPKTGKEGLVVTLCAIGSVGSLSEGNINTGWWELNYSSHTEHFSDKFIITNIISRLKTSSVSCCFVEV